MVHENRIYYEKSSALVCECMWKVNKRFNVLCENNFIKTQSVRVRFRTKRKINGIVMVFAGRDTKRGLKIRLWAFFLCLCVPVLSASSQSKTKQTIAYHGIELMVKFSFIFGLIFRSFDARWLVSCWFSLKPNAAISSHFFSSLASFSSSTVRVMRFHSHMFAQSVAIALI